MICNPLVVEKVTFAQCHAIVEIGRANARAGERSISLNDLAEILELDKSTMSRTINNLVNSDLAVREIDPNDRRYLNIKLTEKGRQSFREIEAGMERYFTQFIRPFQRTNENRSLRAYRSCSRR